jgi:hypothetical protein
VPVTGFRKFDSMFSPSSDFVQYSVNTPQAISPMATSVRRHRCIAAMIDFEHSSAL